MTTETLKPGSAANVSKEQRLSTSGIILLYLKLVTIIPLQVIANIIRLIPYVYSRDLYLGYYLLAALIRTQLQRCSALEIQYLNPGTLPTYRGFITRTKHDQNVSPVLRAKLSIDVEDIGESGARLMWIGDRKTAKKVVYFIHGGGYVCSLSSGHLEWCLAYVRATMNAPHEVAVAILQYTLYPHSVYPGQLRQAAAGLQHLLDSGINSSNIIVGGDSAGGQISSSLCFHLMQPHAKVAPITGFTAPLAGCFLVSPFIATESSSPAFKENKYTDMLSPGILSHTAHFFVHESVARVEREKHQGWCMPSDVDESWFDGLHKVVHRLYVSAGKQELLRDSCIAFAETALRRNGAKLKVQLDVPDEEAHDWIVIEGVIGTEGPATKRLLRWTKSAFEA